MKLNAKQFGWTMIELLLVIVTACSIAAVAVYSVYADVNKQQNIQHVVSLVNEVAQASHQWKLAQPVAMYVKNRNRQVNYYDLNYSGISLNGNYTTVAKSSTHDPIILSQPISLMQLGFIPGHTFKYVKSDNKLHWEGDFLTVSATSNSPIESGICDNNACFNVTYNSSEPGSGAEALFVIFKSMMDNKENGIIDVKLSKNKSKLVITYE